MKSNQTKIRPIGFSPEEISSMINEPVVEQHAENASFLWTQRNAAIYAPNYSLKDLADLDERVDANIDGLVIAGQFGWDLCLEASKSGGDGEIFTTVVLAFESGDTQRIEEVLSIDFSDNEQVDAVIAALGWVDFGKIEPFVNKYIQSKSADLRRIGIASYAVHRQDPGKILYNLILDKDRFVRARALKAVGELGRVDLANHLSRMFLDKDELIAFYAGWATTLLGKKSTQLLNLLQKLVSNNNEYSLPALFIGLKNVNNATAINWYNNLKVKPDQKLLALHLIGYLGDPALIEDLFSFMENDALARISGGMFSLITGVDIEYEDLDKDIPEDFEAGPNDNPEDDNVDMDMYEDYPWPDIDLLKKWWKKNKNNFQKGKRYHRGKVITNETLITALREGMQSQRIIAALELAILNPTSQLFEVRTNGKQQLKRLQ